MAKDILSAKKYINLGEGQLDLSKPRIMGILNITPDSFYGKSRMSDVDAWTRRAAEMVEEGVDIIDLGGYSSRPGAAHISEQEELDRVLPAVESIGSRFDVILSIDTFRSAVAGSALRLGAHMVNDISGGELDPGMFALVAREKVPYIMMHMRGNPQTMRGLTEYTDLLFEMREYFEKKLLLLNETGVSDVIIDVGFGFSKTIEQNYEILRNLDYFKVLGRPLLAGISRKSMIFKTLGTEPSEALNGTTALNTIALMKGADILRVHDVKEAREVITLVNNTFHPERN